MDKTNDRDFETEKRRYQQMENAANRLQKEAKGYLDSLRGMEIFYTVDCVYYSPSRRMILNVSQQ